VKGLFPELKIYDTGHPLSERMCKAVQAGTGGALITPAKWAGGPACFYGILRGNDVLMYRAGWERQDYYHIDHGYVAAATDVDSGDYFRITKNGLQWNDAGNFPSDRWDRLGREILPWKKTGDYILAIEMPQAHTILYGMSSGIWHHLVEENVKKYSKRPIVWRRKDSTEALKKALDGAWAVVVHSSNVAVDALLYGVPAFVCGTSAARMMSLPNLELIETPFYPDRQEWCHALAYQQWTLQEIESGLPWQYIRHKVHFC